MFKVNIKTFGSQKVPVAEVSFFLLPDAWERLQNTEEWGSVARFLLLNGFSEQSCQSLHYGDSGDQGFIGSDGVGGQLECIRKKLKYHTYIIFAFD